MGGSYSRADQVESSTHILNTATDGCTSLARATRLVSKPAQFVWDQQSRPGHEKVVESAAVSMPATVLDHRLDSSCLDVGPISRVALERALRSAAQAERQATASLGVARSDRGLPSALIR
jgi:hypothetical protein